MRSCPTREPAVALYAGLRLGEMFHLQWEDVEFETKGGLIRVRVSDTFVSKDREGRRIPLHSRLRDILLSFKKKRRVHDGLVFPSMRGTPVDSSNALRELLIAAERADIDSRCNWNTLRHTFASWLTMKGVSVHKIARFLGHSSVSTTKRHYAGLVPEILHTDIERLGTVVSEGTKLHARRILREDAA
ncbi:MAG: site-specific integrase [Planctomycetota bacterium]|nr:site-specific integrase [Planctomycetota bacterium]